MASIRLSERQRAALLALAAADTPVTGGRLAEGMSGNGRSWSPAAAHQAAAGLLRKGLAGKRIPDETSKYVRWEITDAGRRAVEVLGE